MVLQRWDPFRDLRRMEVSVGQLWRGLVSEDGHGAGGWAIPLDMTQDDEKVIVRASIPGLKPEDVKVTVDDGVLTIEGEVNAQAERAKGTYIVRERRAGVFRRVVRLPDSADTEHAESTYANGVLEITFLLVEAKKPKSIDVKVAS